MINIDKMMNKICPNPECKITRVEGNENFCPECGTKLVMEEPADTASSQSEAAGAMPSGAFIGEGARINAMGGISQTNTSHTMVGKIEQTSQTIYQKEKKEFCESCGRPFGKEHARCPKCGKEICFDCLVKGKNRCLVCEKRLVKDYQAAFHDALVASNGNINFSLRQRMDQKACDMDLEDVKEELEKEVLKKVKPVQPEVVPIAVESSTESSSASQGSATARGIGSLSGGATVKPKNNGGNGSSKGGSHFALIIGLLLIAVAGIACLFIGGNEDSGQTQQAVQQVEQSTGNQPASKTVSQPATQAGQSVKQSPAAVEKTSAPAQPTVKKDASYEAGMKAYEAKNGLEAISAFQKSGSAKAYYMIGVIYENGCGNVGKNAMLARKNFKKAAGMGSAEAKAKL